MKKATLVGWMLCVLASCSGDMPEFGFRSLGSKDTAPRDFHENLSNEYKNLAAYERDILQDEAAATHFEVKGRKGLRRQRIEPDAVESRDIPDFAYKELADAHSMLIDALAHMQGKDNGALLAMAQSRYDCWLAMQESFPEEGVWISCKPEFYTAMALLNMPENDKGIYAVHFDTGAIALDHESREMVGRLARQYRDRDQWTFVLRGFSDSKGNKHQNEILSMRRAVAVKNTLGQYGVDLNNVAISAEGEERSAGDGADSRRVEITVRPNYLPHNSEHLQVDPSWNHLGGV